MLYMKWFTHVDSNIIVALASYPKEVDHINLGPNRTL